MVKIIFQIVKKMVNSENADFKIRKYQQKERNAIREISVESSIWASSKNKLLNEEIIADLLTAYFLMYEPQSCFVAEREGEVIGYLLGSCNVANMRKVIIKKILPGLAKKIFQDGLAFRVPNLKLGFNLFFSLIKGEFNIPDLTYSYPATLHVNIASPYRGKMLGSHLVEHFLIYLKEKGIKGIHFGVLSEKAKGFFLKLGFEVLYHGQYTFLHSFSGEILPHYIMGKKL